ncbi:MAG TPA: extracellular solute-binding protein, partial [Ilumatobacter sp.]|nr:extracellular solute-binding protein [Ilumatobacter sp.]
MRNRRWSTMSALAVTLALVASACGDDADDDAVATTEPAASATTEPASTEPASTEPASTEPASTEPASTEPAATTPGTEPGDDSLAGTTLTLYSGRNEELTQGVIDAFEAATGVTVEVRYGSSSEMGAALLEEGTSTPADVFYSQEVGAVGVLAKAGLLSPLPDDVVALADERFRPPAENLWVGVTGRSRVIVYNPDLVPEPPTGTLELTDPKWAGQVAIVPGNAGFQAFITGFRVAQGDDAASQWLTDMIANGVRTDIESNGDVLAAVNDGDLPMGLINHYYWGALAEELGEENMAAQLIFPAGDDPGGLFNASAVGITTGGAENPAALAFVEFLLSEEGQTYFVEQTYEYPVVAGIPGPAGYPAMSDLEGPAIDLTDLDSLEVTQALLTD